MQLTGFTDCALRTLLYLSQLPEQEKVSLDAVSRVFNIKRNQMIKVSQKLVQLGLIHSARGKQGGIWLATSASEINLGWVVRTLESRHEIVDCDGLNCPIRFNCRLQGIFGEAEQAFYEVLNRFTLADINPIPDLRTLADTRIPILSLS